MSVGGLRADLKVIAEGADFHAQNFILNNEPDVDELAASIGDFMAVYCETAAILAADWYNSRDRESRFSASPVSVVPPKRATDTAQWVFRGAGELEIRTLVQRVGSAAHSMVFDAARDTVSANANREGVAYVRLEESGACNDCLKLQTASPRARHSSSEDVSWARHQRCEFLFEPVRTGIWTPPEYADNDPLLALDTPGY